MNAIEAARAYVALGWYPVPLKPGQKQCRDADWVKRVYRPEEFHEGDNVGLRLISAADPRAIKLTAVDLDCPETAELAPHFMPTAPAWGRASKPFSQILYDSPFDKPRTFKDEKGEGLLEIRTGAQQSMAPPSSHPSGEVLAWVPGHEARAAPKIAVEDLLRRARLLATCALVRRHYPGGGQRHPWFLALAGALRDLGLTEDEAVLVVDRAAASYQDPDVRDRLAAVRGTYAKAPDGKLTGLGTLVELIGAPLGERVAAAIRGVWGQARTKGRDADGVSEQELVLEALETQLKVTFTRDVFANRLIATNGNGAGETLDDEIVDRLWLDLQTRCRIRVPQKTFDTIVRDAARRRSFHPVRDYLDGLTWDGTPRVNGWLRAYGGAGEGAYFDAVGAITLIAAVRRVRNPGCKFDELLVLEGPQGIGKSSALRALCPRDEWFSDDLPLSIDSKETIERTVGRWIIEAAELVSTRGSQAERLKAMLSRQTDGPVRLAYERFAKPVPRSFIIVGTTNSAQYLHDTTGNRRFWPVLIKGFDLAALARDRDQLWAEAAAREAKGETIRLDPALYDAAGLQQSRRETEDPWHGTLAAKYGPRAKMKISTDDPWVVLRVSVDKRTRADAIRISQIMQKLGFKRSSIRASGSVTNAWVRGAGAKQLALREPEGDGDRNSEI